VNIATDGETYGHHHRFGEMALAYALQIIESHGLAKLTNYGEHLALYPPLHEVQIVENTSWSCSHGLERWRSDCGCNAGGGHGWTQQWRGPLRSSLDWLRDQVSTLFESEGSKVLHSPWDARDAYIDVILDRSDESLARFLAKHAKEGAPLTRVLLLLEMQRNALLMYTSCGWFFSELSGIETVQVIHYAGRVIQLAQQIGGKDFEPGFLTRIAKAISNEPEKGNGRLIYEREVIPARLDLSRVAAHYAVLSLFETFDDDARVYCYQVTRRDFEIHKIGRARLALGIIEVRSTITHETGTFELAALHLGETELTGGVRVLEEGSDYDELRTQLAEAMEPGGLSSVIRILDANFGDSPISIRSLFRDEQRRVLHVLILATLEEAESTFRQLHERYYPLMRFHHRLGVPVPKVLQTAAEFDLNSQFRQLLEAPVPSIVELESRLREARDEGVTFDEMTRIAFADAIDRASENFRERPDDIERLDLLDALVTLVKTAALEVDLRRAQNRYYRMLSAVRPAIVASASANDAARQWVELFDALGAKLAVIA
jgi:hypothetical protein